MELKYPLEATELAVFADYLEETTAPKASAFRKAAIILAANNRYAVDKESMGRAMQKLADSFKNRKIYLHVLTNDPMPKINMCGTNWDGGTINYYHLYNVHSGEFSNIDRIDDNYFDLPLGAVCIQEGYFCGSLANVDVYGRPDEIGELLSDKVIERSFSEKPNEAELKVLKATKCYKSSYGGDNQYRFHHSGITDKSVWDAAVLSCIEKGWLAKNKSITPKGRNLTNG